MVASVAVLHLDGLNGLEATRRLLGEVASDRLLMTNGTLNTVINKYKTNVMSEWYNALNQIPFYFMRQKSFRTRCKVIHTFMLLYSFLVSTVAALSSACRKREMLHVIH